MILKVIYHYAKDDTDFSSDCYEVEITLDGKEVSLPFEEDYPQSHAKAFIDGIMLLNKNITLEEIELADLDC